MTQTEYRVFHAANIAVSVSGIAYGGVRYLLKPDEPFALMHPAQPHLQHLHVLLAPLLVAMIGYFVHGHLHPHLKRDRKRGRRSGLSLVWMAAPMILSGYALQVTVSEAARSIAVWTHIATSVIWMAASIGHVITHLRRRRRAA